MPHAVGAIARGAFTTAEIVPIRPMGYGRWSRWGRGSCEGWSLSIGDALRGQIARNPDGRWRASLSQADLGEHATKEEAQAAVERRIERETKLIFEDWAIGRRVAIGRHARRSGSLLPASAPGRGTKAVSRAPRQADGRGGANGAIPCR